MPPATLRSHAGDVAHRRIRSGAGLLQFAKNTRTGAFLANCPHGFEPRYISKANKKARPLDEHFICFGGDKGVRTPDLLNAIQARARLRMHNFFQFS